MEWNHFRKLHNTCYKFASQSSASVDILSAPLFGQQFLTVTFGQVKVLGWRAFQSTFRTFPARWETTESKVYRQEQTETCRGDSLMERIASPLLREVKDVFLFYMSAVRSEWRRRQQGKLHDQKQVPAHGRESSDWLPLPAECAVIVMHSEGGLELLPAQPALGSEGSVW